MRRRAGPLAVFRPEEAAEVRTRSEHGEVVRRHHVAEDALGPVLPAQAHRLGADAIGVDVRKDGVTRRMSR